MRKESGHFLRNMSWGTTCSEHMHVLDHSPQRTQRFTEETRFVRGTTLDDWRILFTPVSIPIFLFSRGMLPQPTDHSLLKNDPLRMWPSSAKELEDEFAGAEAKLNSSVVADHSICAWLRMNLPVKS